MKSTLIVLFIFLFQVLNAQISLSGGYIRRSDGKPIILADHFWKKPQTYYLYDLAHFQVTKQKTPHKELVGKMDLFFGKKVDYSCSISEYWGSQSSGFYTGHRTYKSQINYSGMNLGFGVNRLFYRSKNTDKKLKAITTLGFLVQVDLLLHSKEKNHYSSYRITKNTGSNPGIKYEESSDTLFKSFDKHYFYFGAGLSFGERVVFKSTYFLELKVNFGITPFQRLVPYMPETNGLYDFKSDFQTSYPYDDLLEFIRPVLQTGISIGYIFPVKKKKAIEPFVGK